MSAHNYAPILTKGLESELVAYEEGLLRFTTDTKRIFLDTGSSSRIEFTDFVKGMTESQILALNIPADILPKFYLASDTWKLYVYDTTTSTWKNIKCTLTASDVGALPIFKNADAFYGTCSTAAATVAKEVILATGTDDNYSLRAGIVLTVKFTYAVPADATITIGTDAAKYIKYNGANITGNIIAAGDTCLFVYNGTAFDLIAMDSIIGLTAGDYGEVVAEA